MPVAAAAGLAALRSDPSRDPAAAAASAGGTAAYCHVAASAVALEACVPDVFAAFALLNVVAAAAVQPHAVDVPECATCWTAAATVQSQSPWRVFAAASFAAAGPPVTEAAASAACGRCAGPWLAA